MRRLEEAYGRLLGGLALAACGVLFLMMAVICVDVLLRNVRLVPGLLGLPWANEVTEYALYVVTVLTAPWLLREGRHIRVDVLLRALPARLAWTCEWAVDLIALACCLAIGWYGFQAVLSSRAIGGMVIKVIAVPEWWLLAPLPAAFALLAIEALFRMRRLWSGPRAPREDAVSSA